MSNIRNLNNGKGRSQPIQRTVDIDETTLIECECGSTLFEPAWRQGRLSFAHEKNPTNETVTIPFQTMLCKECGKELEVNP